MRNSQPFFQMTAPFDIPTSNVAVFQFPCQYMLFLFSFSIVKMLHHCVLICSFPLRSPAIIVSVYIMSLTAFRVLFDTSFEQSDYNVADCSFLHDSFALGSLVFLNFWVYHFDQIWKILGHPFFKYFLSPFFSFGNSNYTHTYMYFKFLP